MNWHARALLRRIALGLPLVVAPGAMLLSQGCYASPYIGCPGVSNTTEHEITQEQHDSLVGTSSTIDSTACTELCTSLDAVTADATGADAGPPLPPAGMFSVRCALDRPGSAEILTCSYTPFCRGGRAPAGLVAVAHADEASVAAWLARSAHLERASVDAFEDLAIELALHGAPPWMASAARSAASDERRHAHAVASLALRHGARVPAVRRIPTEPRALRAIAEDNAREGCVREAFAALEAAHQAQHAADPTVRAVYATIARDEARHALLSGTIAEWSGGLVGARGRRSVEDERQLALAELAADVTRGSGESDRWLGVPDPTRASELARALA